MNTHQLLYINSNRLHLTINNFEEIVSGFYVIDNSYNNEIHQLFKEKLTTNSFKAQIEMFNENVPFNEEHISYIKNKEYPLQSCFIFNFINNNKQHICLLTEEISKIGLFEHLQLKHKIPDYKEVDEISLLLKSYLDSKID